MQISTGEIFLFFGERKSAVFVVFEIRKPVLLFFIISSVIREAEANRLKLTPEFLELKFIESIANNTKIFFGDKVFLSS